MEAKHWTVLGACLVSIAALGANLPSWGAALAPGFVFPALGAIGATLAGIYTDKPTQ